MKRERTVTVFGSSLPKEGDAAYGLACDLGRELAARGIRVCNGGYGGTMEAAARGARQVGGRTVGVTIRDAGRPNDYLDEVVVCADLWERLRTLLGRGDGYAILPGGTGTLAEVGVLLESINKGLTAARPFVFVTDFWTPLLHLLSRERLLRTTSRWATVEGVTTKGAAATACSPEAAAGYLAANL